MELEKMTEEQLLESIENIDVEKERLDSDLCLYGEALRKLRQTTYVGKFFIYSDMGFTTYMKVLSQSGEHFPGYMYVFQVEFGYAGKDDIITAASIGTNDMEYLRLQWIEITREEFIEARDRAISFITSQVT